MILSSLPGYLMDDSRSQSLAQRIALGNILQPVATRIEIFLNNSCNFKCHYCRSIYHDMPDWNLALIENNLHKWATSGTQHIHWTGGEPTLHPHLLQLVKLSKELGMSNSISTNGSSTTVYYAELVEAGMERFFISLDHINPALFEHWTSSYQQLPNVIKAINFLCRYKKVYLNLRIIINIILTPSSVASLLKDQARDLRELLLWSIACGADDFKLLPSSITPLDNLFANASEREQFFIICRETVPSSFHFFHYRLQQLSKGGHGLHGEQHTCFHFIDDRAFDSLGAYSCIIHLREGGTHLYHHSDTECEIEKKVQSFLNKNRLEDPICQRHCFDIYRDFSNRVAFFLTQL